MARDYKPRGATQRRRRKRQSPPGWLWLIAGLAIGLFVAFLFYLQQKPDAPAQAAVAVPPQDSQTIEVPAKGQDAREVRKPAAKVVPPPPPAKPRFDFYTILPEMEVPVPEDEITGKAREGVPQVEAPGTYLLQAGSFRTHEQADQLKAKLALLGLQAEIQTVTINNQETWHRVRVGPFTELDALNTARARLKENNLDAILLRVGG
jgi:cell division protein FtsN